MGKDGESRAIVRTILALAHSLQMDVIAEGAETLDHCKQLTELGCEYAQGYFYSPPVPMPIIAMLLRAQSVLPRNTTHDAAAKPSALLAGMHRQSEPGQEAVQAHLASCAETTCPPPPAASRNRVLLC